MESNRQNEAKGENIPTQEWQAGEWLGHEEWARTEVRLRQRTDAAPSCCIESLFQYLHSRQ